MLSAYHGKKRQFLARTDFFGTVMLNHPILNKHSHQRWPEAGMGKCEVVLAQALSEKDGFFNTDF